MCHNTFAIFMKFHEAKDCGIPFVLLLALPDQFPFPANFIDRFVKRFFTGFIRSVLLVGGMTALTTALMRSKKCRNLSVSKTQVLFFRIFPQFKRINAVSKFIGFEINLAQMFVTHQGAKVCEAFMNFQYFSCGVPARDGFRKYIFL